MATGETGERRLTSDAVDVGHTSTGRDTRKPANSVGPAPWSPTSDDMCSLDSSLNALSARRQPLAPLTARVLAL